MFKYIGNSIFHFQPYFEIIVSFNKTNVYFTILKRKCVSINLILGFFEIKI